MELDDLTAAIERAKAGPQFPRLRGVAHHSAKLDATKAQEMRMLYATGGITQRGLAKHFGVSQDAVWKVLSGRTWAPCE